MARGRVQASSFLTTHTARLRGAAQREAGVAWRGVAHLPALHLARVRVHSAVRIITCSEFMSWGKVEGTPGKAWFTLRFLPWERTAAQGGGLVGSGGAPWFPHNRVA